MEISDINEEIYTEHDVVVHLTHTVQVLHQIGTKNTQLTEDERLALQYAHDCLKSIRNAHIEMLKKVEAEKPAAPAIVTARKGDSVKAVSGLQFRKKPAKDVH